MELVNIISQVIFDKKGFNILALDVRGISSMTDFFIIAEGSVDRHVKALSNEVVDKMKEFGERPIHVEGEKEGEWIVLDYLNIVVHLFIPSFREKYHLEELWKDAGVVSSKIDPS